MNLESQLKLQAYLDNELSSREARQVSAWVNRDSEAQALLQELKSIKGFIIANEPETALPEAGDFYWSKIRRSITNLPAESKPAYVSRIPAWSRIFVPVGAAALVAAALLTFGQYYGKSAPRLSSINELETAIEDMSAISFHSERHGMTVVWVSNNSN